MGGQVGSHGMCSSCSSAEDGKKRRTTESYEIFDGIASETAYDDELLHPHGELREYPERSIGRLGLPVEGVASTPWEALCSQDVPGGFTASQLCATAVQRYPVADDQRGQRMQVTSMSDMRNDRISQWTQANSNNDIAAWAMPCLGAIDSNELNLDPRPPNYLADTYDGTIVLNPVAGAVWVDDNILKRDRIAKEIRLKEYDLKEARIAGFAEQDISEIQSEISRLKSDLAIVAASIEVPKRNGQDDQDQPARGGAGGGSYQTRSAGLPNRVEHGALPGASDV